MAVQPIREGFHTITPYLVVREVKKLIRFLEEAFGAVEHSCKMRPDGTVMHAELQIGDSHLMAGEPTGDFNAMPASIYLYVEDCDRTYEKALVAGGISIMEPTTMHHAGERYGGVRDPSGNIWWIATHVEDLSPEEQERRTEEFFENQRRD